MPGRYEVLEFCYRENTWRYSSSHYSIDEARKQAKTVCGDRHRNQVRIIDTATGDRISVCR